MQHDTPLCIYHANCTDGFTAAWVVWKHFHRMVDCIPASYGSTPPDVSGRDVIIVDFSYPRDQLLEMAKSARSLLVLDHHQTAQKNLQGLPCPSQNHWRSHLAEIETTADNLPRVEFDMSRSGAQMAYDFFQPHRLHRTLVDYTADRDLWQWALPFSKEINAKISIIDHDLSAWNELALELNDPDLFHSHCNEGVVILKHQDHLIKHILATSTTTMSIGGFVVPVAPAPYMLASDTAGRLANTALFAATYVDTPTGRQFSLRSRKDGGADVAEIAEIYGGGGHRNAAGFSAARGWIGGE